MQANIAILVCYLGPLPEYFPLWVKSCAANPSFDFLLLTDQQPEGLPPNVHCIETSLPALRQQFTEKLGFEISLERPYKLCDFKPLYGELFEELLRPYDFWGHCDLDQIFGCLSDFIDDALLKRYDKFYKLGHLAIYRNDPACNARYRLPGYRADWREVVTKPTAYLFDEDGMNAIYAQGGFPVYFQPDYADISPIYRRFKRSEFLLDDAQKRNNNYDRQVFYWEDGRLLRAFVRDGVVCSDAFAYIHFQRRGFGRPAFDMRTAERFYITPDGFLEKPRAGLPDPAEIDRCNPYPGALRERLEKLDFSVRRCGGRLLARLQGAKR